MRVTVGRESNIRIHIRTNGSNSSSALDQVGIPRGYGHIKRYYLLREAFRFIEVAAFRRHGIERQKILGRQDLLNDF